MNEEGILVCFMYLQYIVVKHLSKVEQEWSTDVIGQFIGLIMLNNWMKAFIILQPIMWKIIRLK